MLKLISLFSIVYLHYLGPYLLTTADFTNIDPSLKDKLDQGLKLDVVVWFKNGVHSTLRTASAARFADRSSKINTIVAALRENADSSQDGVINMLTAKRSGDGDGFKYYKKYWTNNKLFLKEADQETVYAVADDPQVSRISIASISKIYLPPTQPDAETETTTDQDSCEIGILRYPWNIKRIQAKEAWDHLGSKGEGVVVATIDSGIRHTHKYLKDGYRGEYGWFDGVAGALEPYDPVGHGSHVMGIMAGKGEKCKLNIGVAPDVKWMTCLACPTEDCHFEHIMNCIKFIICPTFPDGSNEDCSKAPHVLNFSIAGERSGEPFDEDFATLRTLGIIPVAGIGNNGPECATTESPGQWPFAIGVGATQFLEYIQLEDVSALSGIGPAFDGRIQPDLVAPGTGIYGPTNTSDSQLVATLGTSNASPHVAGVVALLHVRNPDITYEEVYELLTKNTDIDIKVPHKKRCNESGSAEEIPNNFFGFGRLNALKVLQAQTAAMEAKRNGY